MSLWLQRFYVHYTYNTQTRLAHHSVTMPLGTTLSNELTYATSTDQLLTE